MSKGQYKGEGYGKKGGERPCTGLLLAICGAKGKAPSQEKEILTIS